MPPSSAVRLAHFALLFIAHSAPTAAQGPRVTHTVWALDQTSANLKAFNGALDPVVVQSIPLAGTGMPRALSFDAFGLGFVCRGDEVRTYDGGGGVGEGVLFAGPSVGVFQAQHALERPGSSDIYVACGATTSTSKILRFDLNGVLLATLTTPLLDHPRRLAWSPTGSLLYVASTGNKRILSYDPATGIFAQVIDLSAQNVSPVGLAYDVVRTGLWVTGDWGSSGGGIGFVTLPPAAASYVSALSTTAIPGLTAPAGLFFDRFRNLYAAGRNLNGGVGGVYCFAASVGATPTFAVSITGLGLQNILDAVPRPELIGIVAPVDPSDATKRVLNASVSGPMSNTLQFRSPSGGGKTYYAAMSMQWPVSCAPYTPSTFDALMQIPGSDPRGVPVIPDYFFRQTAGLCCPSAPPPLAGLLDAPLFPFVQVIGFVGGLNGNGDANASINFSAGIPLAADGALFSIAFVVIDPASSSLFGPISNALCVTLKVAP